MRIFSDTRGSPESLNKSTLHFVGYKGHSAERACSLIVPHPTVQTSSVEYVATIRQLSDLIVFLELAQTHRARLRGVHQLPELHHRQDFPDERGRHGFELFGHSGLGFGPGNVGLEEVVEAHEAEEAANQLPEEAQEGEDVKEKLREQELRVPHWETHQNSDVVSFRVKRKSERERESEVNKKKVRYIDREEF